MPDPFATYTEAVSTALGAKTPPRG
jgi:hypothetical protein